MNPRLLSIAVSPAIGKVSAAYIGSPKSKCIMTLAHGAGAGMNHVFMTTLAELLGEAGIATLRFNFPFMEQKKGRADIPAVAHQTIAAAIAVANERFPDLPLFAGGKSFGGRMTSQYISANPRPEVKGLIFYGFPLHAAGKPSTDRAAHLSQVKTKMLFLQGARDALAQWDLIEAVCASLPKATLIRIDKADHMFKAGKEDTMALLVAATKAWVEKIIR
jgi:predicted alpha/beta-hydrolase family hydrolase